jgi:5-methylcytosine-specific restriction endonuclease McrA
MLLETLEPLVDEGLSIRQIAGKLDTSATNIRYWLRVHNLKTNCRHNRYARDISHTRKCSCGESDPNKFYGNKFWVCAKCWNSRSVQRSKEKVAWARKKLGGKCAACGFDKYDCALDIHHLVPAEKDVAFRTMRFWSLSRIEKEIEKCVLLCKNCHAAVHAGEIVLEKVVAAIVQSVRTSDCGSEGRRFDPD